MFGRSSSWSWVEAQVAHTIRTWTDCAEQPIPGGMRYGPTEQGTRERAYDDGLWAVEREVKQVPLTKTERLAAQDRLIATFARFAASALGLEMGAVDLITNDFLPAGAEFARGARKFDAGLSRWKLFRLAGTPGPPLDCSRFSVSARA